MKFILCVTSIFLMTQNKTFAATMEPLRLGSDVTYTRTAENKVDTFPKEIDSAIGHAAFIKLPGTGANKAPNSIDLMNRIYIPEKFGTTDDNRLIVGLSGISVTGKVKYEELYETGTGYIVHFKTDSSGVVALFFKGFSQDRIQTIKDEISKNLKNKSASNYWVNSWKISALRSTLLQNSYAADAKSRCDLTGISSAPNQSMNATTMQKVWTCAEGFKDGVWDATGGVLVSLGKGILHPIDTFNTAAEDFRKINAFLADFKESFADLKAGFEALPILEQGKILCETVTAVGTAAIATFFTLGGGSPMLFRALANAALKVAKSLPAKSIVAAKTFALGASLAKKAATAEENLAQLKSVPSMKKYIDAVESKPYYDPKLHGALTPEFAAMRRKDIENLYKELKAAQNSTNLSATQKAAVAALITSTTTCLATSINSTINSSPSKSLGSEQTAPAAR